MRPFCSLAHTFAFILFTFFSVCLSAQVTNCGVTVNAGPDQVFCTPGQSLQLNGTVSGDYLSAMWSPATGLGNANSLSTSVTTNAPATYTLTVKSLSGPNLVTNGDFSQGNTGFTTNYTLGTTGQFGPVTNTGTYGITTVANLVHSQFAACTDHTGGGQMMVVNGATTPRNIWCQTVTVQPGTEYAFSAWFAVVAIQNPSILRFTINSVTIGNNFTLPSVTCEWTQFFRLWNSGAATTAEICIANVSTGAAGNDFCLDDISMRRVCETTGQVSLSPANLNPAFIVPTALCVNSPVLVLNSLLTPTSTPGGQWTVNGNPTTTFDPAASGPGTYALRYRVQVAQCAEEVTRNITVAALPRAGTPLPPPQFCSGAPQSVNLIALLSGADPGGVWIETSASPSSPGAFNASAGTLQAQSLQPGNYTFQYRVAGTAPCPDATASVMLTIISPPVANAGPDQTLDCRMRQVSIGSSGSSSGPEITYTWSSPTGGAILQPGLAITDVEMPGAYVLTVRHAGTGCESRDTVMVASLVSEPRFNLDIRPVTCAGDADGAITVTSIEGAAAPYSFSIDSRPLQPGGNFTGLASGNFSIRLEDANGCFAERQAFLPEPPPIALELDSDLGALPLLRLGDSTRLRVLSNLTANEIQSLTWDPEVPGCVNCLAVTVGPIEKTKYSVTLTDRNGCSNKAELTIFIERVQRVFVPSAFSPNDDGINDRLTLLAGPEVSQILSFRVVDRWGNIVFQTANVPPNDPQHGWDGRVKGKQPAAGVYVYFAEVELVDGARAVISGDTAILR